MKKIVALGLLLLSVFNAVSQLPNPAMVGYWENWMAGNFVHFSEVDPTYNVIMVSFASYKDESDYELDFVPEPGMYWQDSTLFPREMSQLQSEGKKVLLSIGGATYPVILDSLKEKEVFVSSVTALLDKWNFDGIDIDLEGTSLHFKDFSIDSFVDPKLTLMVEAIQEIMVNYRSKYNKKLLLTMAPETHYVHGGMSEGLVSNKHGGAYLPIIEALRDSIDMLNVQLYNSGDMPGVNGVYYKQSTPDFILALTEAVIQGFTGAGKIGSFSGLPASKIGVALPSCGGWGYTEPKVLEATMQYLLGEGPQPGEYSLVQEGGYPNLRGMMTWSINTDKNCDDTHSFVKLYNQLFNEVSYLNISNPDTILISEENGGEIWVEIKNNSFKDIVNRKHWTVANLPPMVELNDGYFVNDSTVKLVLKGNSTPGAVQFHISNVEVNAFPDAFVNPTDTLSKNYGVQLTSPGYFLPTRIEAENFHKMEGSEINPTSANDSKLKLGGGTTGAYSDYKVIVPETKTYQLDFRYATAMNNKADFSILVDGVEVLRDTLSSSGGWDAYRTNTYPISLTEGKHLIRIHINLGWYGLNWFEIKEEGLGIDSEPMSLSQLNFYPNPVKDILRFQSAVLGKIKVLNSAGKVVHHSVMDSNELNVAKLPPGLYLVVISHKNGSLKTGKFIKE